MCEYIENIKAIFGVKIGLSCHAEIAQTYYKQLRWNTKDDVRAHMWLDLAASRGNSLAEHGRNLLAKKMSPSQITEAQGMADDCEKNNYQDCN